MFRQALLFVAKSGGLGQQSITPRTDKRSMSLQTLGR
jgi:hypothetical protein